MFPWHAKTNGKQPQTLSDEELCVSAASGNGSAFQELFERYWGQVFRLTFAIVHSDAEAEDVAQSVFVELHCRAKEFDSNKGSFCNWLLRYAYTRAIDQKRYLHARKYYDQDQLTQDDLTLRADETALMFHLSLDEASHLVKQLLVQLNDKQRLIMELYFFEGRTLHDIASEINETYGNTRHMMYRGLTKLRELVLAPAPAEHETKERMRRVVESGVGARITEAALARARTV